jgi:hypothetical protein
MIFSAGPFTMFSILIPILFTFQHMSDSQMSGASLPASSNGIYFPGFITFRFANANPPKPTTAADSPSHNSSGCSPTIGHTFRAYKDFIRKYQSCCSRKSRGVF